MGFQLTAAVAAGLLHIRDGQEARPADSRRLVQRLAIVAAALRVGSKTGVAAFHWHRGGAPRDSGANAEEVHARTLAAGGGLAVYVVL